MEFDDAVAELDELVNAIEAEADERGLRLLQLLDAVHRPGLAALAAGAPDDPYAYALLAMYGFVPVDDRTLVEEALNEVRPYIHSHGGEVELLDVADGIVHVRLSGSCRGCPASEATLKRGIEAVLRERYDLFRQLVAHEPGRDEPLLQLGSLRRPVFVDVAALSDVPSGELRAVTVEGVAVLLANVAGEIYAFRNSCPVDGLPLDGGRLADTVLVCPWHNCAFDARNGRSVDGEARAGLTVVPIAIGDGSVRVAVNVA